MHILYLSSFPSTFVSLSLLSLHLVMISHHAWNHDISDYFWPDLAFLVVSHGLWSLNTCVWCHSDPIWFVNPSFFLFLGSPPNSFFTWSESPALWDTQTFTEPRSSIPFTHSILISYPKRSHSSLNPLSPAFKHQESIYIYTFNPTSKGLVNLHVHHCELW